MSNSPNVNSDLVKKVAQLSSIPVNNNQAQDLAEKFEQTLETINNLQTVDTKNVEPTHQVTGLENVWREDEVKPKQSFTQQQALANAKKSHDGYFVVPRILDQKDA
jgi:aspartyl-tRNA(Asn)/glutamyl-tRNA(Gln) amidotransferase subunit C